MESSSKQHREETVKAVCAIHGDSVDDMAPATIGMVETMERKCKEKEEKSLIRDKLENSRCK